MGNRVLVRRCRGSHDHRGCTDYKVRKGQIAAVSLAASALEEAFMNVVEFPQISFHSQGLVIRSIKVGREPASGEIRRHFGAEFFSAANAGNIGACKSWKSGEPLVLALVWCLEGIIKRHTYRMKETRA